MSQAKVDRNKEAKKNRKKTLEGNRRRRRVGIILSIVILLGLVSGGGYLGYQRYEAYQKTHVKSTVVDLTEISQYLSTVTR